MKNFTAVLWKYPGTIYVALLCIVIALAIQST
ncbi:hypothetical protein SAMN05421850_1209 [Lutimaribacter saemankumensis]|uniref:Uncharacterized protein n=1 Tax=Lutimaribacter saemankumensis TaxID=490829 RepID=A0A1G8TCC1_9RHOB|nr:hypothetical protein SAMN05421850_1209 [Lutimaribacter saemankumensis]